MALARDLIFTRAEGLLLVQTVRADGSLACRRLPTGTQPDARLRPDMYVLIDPADVLVLWHARTEVARTLRIGWQIP